ncbi:MAG: hypothetical protein ACK5D5_06695 [Bacteroidota bacterium]|jgi:hypothetical protein
MLNKFYLSILFLLSLIESNAQLQGRLPGLVKKVDPSVLKIYTIDEKNQFASQGSGVIIAKNGI